MNSFIQHTPAWRTKLKGFTTVLLLLMKTLVMNLLQKEWASYQTVVKYWEDYCGIWKGFLWHGKNKTSLIQHEWEQRKKEWEADSNLWWRARVKVEEELGGGTLPGGAPVEFSPKVETARVIDRKREKEREREERKERKNKHIGQTHMYRQTLKESDIDKDRHKTGKRGFDRNRKKYIHMRGRQKRKDSKMAIFVQRHQPPTHGVHVQIQYIICSFHLGNFFKSHHTTIIVSNLLQSVQLHNWYKILSGWKDQEVVGIDSVLNNLDHYNQLWMFSACFCIQLCCESLQHMFWQIDVIGIFNYFTFFLFPSVFF